MAVSGGAMLTAGGGELVEDIDVLILRLERISLDLFKKKPEELRFEETQEAIEEPAAATAAGK